MSVRDILIVVLIAAIGLTGVVWFLSTHEKVTEPAWTGLRGEARRNPWLAAERFLNRVATPAKELRTLPELRKLPANATLIVPQAHQAISARLRDALVEWVRQGGYLIVEAEHPAQRDLLTDAFGVRRSAIASDRPERKGAESDEPKFDEITLPNAAAPAAINLNTAVSLEADNAWFQADSRHATWLVTVRFGAGMVTVVSDLDYLSNGAIGHLDHAQFLWDLVRLHEFAASTSTTPSGDAGPGVTEQQPVLFFSQPDKLSLLSWLRENAWAPLAGGALALLLWLWRIIPRFGPVTPDAGRDRRSLLDHLRASGRFLWTNGHGTRLLEASREACLRRLARSLPYFRSATPQERLTQLVQTLGINEEQARRILQPQESSGMLQFLHTIRVYQRVYSRLAVRQTKTAARPG